MAEITHKNFIGEELKVNDIVIYLQNCRTGDSTTRKCKFVGKVTDFASSKVIITPLSEKDMFAEPENYTEHNSVKIFSDDIICILNK